MKIIHITENYIPGWGYQENLLPKYQKLQGHDVIVISDNEHLKYIQNRSLSNQIIAKGREYEEDGIKVYKIKTYLNTSSTSFLCKGLFPILQKEKPDIIFHHNLNTSTLVAAAYYKLKNSNVKLYVDNHVDWINESKKRIWHWLYYDTIMPSLVYILGDLVDSYIGVSPLRCKYLHQVFNVPETKVRFLPIGCDTNEVQSISATRESLRNANYIPLEDFVISYGGKIDRSKGVFELIEACKTLKERGEAIHLILFGKIDNEVEQAIKHLDWISNMGWCNRSRTMSILKMSDVACWPLLHTTLIEDAVAAGTPLVVKMSDNVSHFSEAKAGIFLQRGDTDELIDAMMDIKSNIDTYRANVLFAREQFSYWTLSKNLENGTFFPYEQYLSL